MWKWRYISTFLDLSTRWRPTVIFMSLSFTSGKEPLVPIRKEVGWDPESVWTLWIREKNLYCWKSNPGL
jgi:hypothetical protein